MEKEATEMREINFHLLLLSSPLLTHHPHPSTTPLNVLLKAPIKDEDEDLAAEHDAALGRRSVR